MASSLQVPAPPEAPAAMDLVRATPAAIRAALRALPVASWGALATAAMGAGLAAAFALGICATWWFAGLMSTPALPEAPGIAASFLIDLAVLSAALIFLPLDLARPWGFLRAWLQSTALAAAAMAGLVLAPASGTTWSGALELLALVSAQVAGLCGCASVLTWLTGGRCRAVRAILALLLALVASSLLWTKPALLPPYGKEHPRQRAMLIRAVLTVGPLTSLAGAWNEQGSDFDLVKGTNTYNLWIGSYYLAEYAKLWPSHQEPEAAAQPKVLASGLVFGLGLWGLGLLAWSDLLGFVWRGAHAPKAGRQ